MTHHKETWAEEFTRLQREIASRQARLALLTGSMPPEITADTRLSIRAHA